MKMEENHIEVLGPDENKSLSARLPKDTLRSLFHVIAGKPDSITKVFHRPVIVTPNEVIDLNTRVNEKLQQHNVHALVVLVSIAYSKNVVKDFSWAEYSAHRWTGADITKSLTIRWDFMINMPGYQIPQRHTLTVRVAAEHNPMHILQIALNQSAELEKADTELAPVFCKVDFINALLSEELVNIVTGWHESLSAAVTESAAWKLLRRFDQAVHMTIHQLFRVSAGVSVCLVLWRYLVPKLESITPAKSAAAIGTWLIVSMVLIDLFEVVGHLLGGRISRRLGRHARYVVLQMTRGDLNRRDELARDNKKTAKSVFLNILLAIVANLLTNALVWFSTRP